jgi:hypothetical protein
MMDIHACYECDYCGDIHHRLIKRVCKKISLPENHTKKGVKHDRKKA